MESLTVQEIARLLANHGINVLGVSTDGANIIIQDPSCIIPAFKTFIDYAWVVIMIITCILLFGWAVHLIRGTKNGLANLASSLKNLIIMFGVLGAVWPILHVIYGKDLSGMCNKISVPIAEINELYNEFNTNTLEDKDKLYEEFNIEDTGPTL